MWVKMATVSTDCSGEKQDTAPTFRISKNIGHRIRRPLIFGTTRARPENTYHDMMDRLTTYATSDPAATPRMPNDGIGPRPRPSVPPKMIWQVAEESISSDGSFMLPVPRKTPAKVFISQGTTAPPKNICT